MSAERLTTVPNLLSLSRLPLGAGVFAAIAAGAWVVAAVLFAIAILTDWLDGYLARLWNLQSQLGRNLDPLTDKVLIGGAFIYLQTVPSTGVLPWMTTVVIARELLVTGLRGLVESTGAKFGADWFGKLKTVLQSAAILALILNEAQPEWPRAVGSGLLWAAVAATLGSGVQYVVKAGRILGKPR
ncbi:MAG: CDP-diacylglycerol--glycerol-3-phosphate 3-phosphatidyltransferase [Gemmataceae bacterium]